MDSDPGPSVFDSEIAGTGGVLGERLLDIRHRIAAAGGNPEVIRIIAVTKGFGPEVAAGALEAGLFDLGENYAQELVAKASTILPRTEAGHGARWHYLGAIQRNKVRSLASVVDCWQSVSRVEEGIEIARRHPGAAVFVEVDVTAVPGRNGCTLSAAPDLVKRLTSMDLAVRGLMTVAPRTPEAARAAFRAVRLCAENLGLPERSMGMSDDLEIAVAEGSTMLRLGTALFGPRPVRDRF